MEQARCRGAFVFTQVIGLNPVGLIRFLDCTSRIPGAILHPFSKASSRCYSTQDSPPLCGTISSATTFLCGMQSNTGAFIRRGRSRLARVIEILDKGTRFHCRRASSVEFLGQHGRIVHLQSISGRVRNEHTVQQ